MELEVAERVSVGGGPTAIVTVETMVPPAGFLHVTVYVFPDVK